MWFFCLRISVFSDLWGTTLVNRVDPNFYFMFFYFLRGGGGLFGYCMMIEIAQMALSYYLNKLMQKDCFLNHHGGNDPESAARARGAICRTVKSIRMIQSAKRE